MDALTDLYLRTLKPRVARFEVTDAKAHGLRIRVSPSGKKTWVFMFRQHGRLYRKTLGRYPTVTLAAARAQVAVDREALEKKVNPVMAGKEAVRQAALIEARDPLISDLCSLYIERYASVDKKTWREDQRVLLKDVVPR